MLKTQDQSYSPRFLLVGPYDPHCGEYTFLAPPLGVWRLAGVLESAGIAATVFDPNCCEGHSPDALLEKILSEQHWDVVGISTTGMTLRYDLQLAHLARRVLPRAVIVAGGMEATFKPELMFTLGPFDLVVLGEGEKPLLEMAARLSQKLPLDSIPGTAEKTELGFINRHPQSALNKEELSGAIAKTPYEKMPYPAYWERLESALRVGELPVKADREARLSEVRSVRLITLNYCPMGCTFCSSTNFLNAAQGGTAGIARLDVDECMDMIKRIIAAHPAVRTIIFQDDIFVFTQDRRILPLCNAIIEARKAGEIPHDLQFISTNRIDAMNDERLTAMRNAGFRVLGFGVESFSPGVLKEFNKSCIYNHVDRILTKALDLGITPFLDLILTSPRCGLHDLSETIRQSYRWLLAGCEIGMYPYVIPFSGAAMANDPELEPFTVYTRQTVAGASVEWLQPAKILPMKPLVRKAIVAIENEYNQFLEYLEARVPHLPSRVRSLVWVICASPVLAELGESAPDPAEVLEQLLLRLPRMSAQECSDLRQFAVAARPAVLVNA